MRPIIALTCSAEQPAGTAQPRDFVSHAYSAAVRRAGGTPVLIPASDDEEPVRHALGGVAGVLITGGKDISPAVYGEEVLPFCGPIDPSRDDLDRWVIEAARELHLPVLAICRGIQALAAFLGGTLYQDIAEQVEKAHSHRQDAPRHAPSHTIRAAPGTLLAGIVGDDDLPVNSFHHQAVKDVPAALTVCARAPDGIIEGLEADGSRFVLGVQWHPEEMAADDRRQQALFDAFVEAAR
jgi:putative glutamine amidotransferase